MATLLDASNITWSHNHLVQVTLLLDSHEHMAEAIIRAGLILTKTEEPTILSYFLRIEPKKKYRTETNT